MNDKNTLAFDLLKLLLNTELTEDQQTLITDFLKSKLIKYELDPIKEHIERKIETNLRAMTIDIISQQLLNYLQSKNDV